ncbi:MAG: PKD domain-containing protein, partial [candidate division Zixibacteria bacterium]|nr:PKD domain-containing protein [candidate division Zixibacteria bacterium]
YDAGIDEFEPPPPPGDFVRTYFYHPEWAQMQNEFNSDIRSPFSTLCKDFVLTVQTNVAEEITLSLPEVANPGCYKISLLSADGSAVLVDNFEADNFTFMGSATHFFRIRVCAGGGGIAPVITCPPADIDVTLCAAGEVCIDLPVANYETVTVSSGTWVNGQFCFTASHAGRYVFDVTASNNCGDDVCHFAINVTIDSAPVIDCPQVELVAERCGPGQVCVPLAITGAETVTAGEAAWADGQLCFDAPASDAYGFQVIAVNDCGEDTCDILVNVTINDVPVIDCPQEPIAVMIAPGETCVPLAITGATSVTVESGDWTASWAEGQFCFDASVLGEFGATITATNDCGEVNCAVTVIVQDCPLPVVDCPVEPMDIELCELETIAFPLAVTGADDVTVSGGAWADDMFAFLPPSFGTFEFTVTATNECGPVVCNFTVNVTEIPAVAIECPGEPFFYILCAPEEICIDMPIANADEVVITGGAATWVDGQFCFTAEPSTIYSFTVTASNVCGEALCVVDFLVDSYNDPIACFTADPTEGTVPLEVTFTDCSEIDTEGADYMWDFGDGSTSTDMSPMHIFETIGCYDVSLTITDLCGRQDMTMQRICVLDDQIVTPTDQWINIYCPEPMLEGVPLNPGDYITAYDPDGILCGMGQVEPDGSYGMIPIYADDIYTGDVDEGAVEGDLSTLKINGVPVATDPPLFWTENGAVFMVCDFTAELCLSYELDAGWHLISWNVAYTGAVEEAIADFVGCVDVVMSFDRGGLTYDPTLPEFSTLATVDFYHGYWLRLSCPVTFDI